jgi:hypothetical protein
LLNSNCLLFLLLTRGIIACCYYCLTVIANCSYCLLCLLLVDEMAGHVTYVGEKRKAQGVGGGHEWQASCETYRWTGCVMLKWVLKEQDGMAWTGLVWLRIGTGGGMNFRVSWLAEGLFRDCCMGPVTCSCCGWCAWQAVQAADCVANAASWHVGSKFHQYPSGSVNWLVIPVLPSLMTVAMFSATLACPKSHHCIAPYANACKQQCRLHAACPCRRSCQHFTAIHWMFSWLSYWDASATDLQMLQCVWRFGFMNDYIFFLQPGFLYL